MALTRGDQITSLEGVNFEGNTYAVVVRVEEDPAEANKQLVTLYFPESGVARRYKLPNNVVGIVDTGVVEPGKEVTEDPIPNSYVDDMRLDSPGWKKSPIRKNMPDSYFPEDPNYPSTITDVLWRPDMRWTPFPRFYDYKKRRIMKRRQAESGEYTIHLDFEKDRKGNSTRLLDQIYYLVDEYYDSIEIESSGGGVLEYSMVLVSTSKEEAQNFLRQVRKLSLSGPYRVKQFDSMIDGGSSFPQNRKSGSKRNSMRRRRRGPRVVRASSTVGGLFEATFGRHLEDLLDVPLNEAQEMADLSVRTPVGLQLKEVITSAGNVTAAADNEMYPRLAALEKELVLAIKHLCETLYRK
jgi:hypothetical protein